MISCTVSEKILFVLCLQGVLLVAFVDHCLPLRCLTDNVEAVNEFFAQGRCEMHRNARGCDLHTHTTASDGSETSAQLVRLAAEAGLAAIAITDHDTVDGLSAALESGDRLGIEVLSGVELSVQVPRGNMHLLGYLIDRTSPALHQVLERVQSARARRNPQILAKLEELGLPVSQEEVESLAQGGQVGRPHIARAMVGRGYVRSAGEAFGRYLKQGASAYVPKSILSPEEGISAIRQAGGLAVLAHPISLGLSPSSPLEPLVGQWVEQGLEGIECYYTEHSREITSLCLDICAKYRLVATGGSDYHGRSKPAVHLGRGRGGLHVPYSCVVALRKRWARRSV